MSWLPDWITGYDAANAAKALAADKALRDKNAVDYAPGGAIYDLANASQGQAYADAMAARVAADYAAQDSFLPTDQRAAIDAAAAEGAAQGLTTMQDKFKGALTKIGLGALGFIPWWVWPLAAVGVFFYFGGGTWLRRRTQ